MDLQTLSTSLLALVWLSGLIWAGVIAFKNERRNMTKLFFTQSSHQYHWYFWSCINLNSRINDLNKVSDLEWTVQEHELSILSEWLRRNNAAGCLNKLNSEYQMRERCTVRGIGKSVAASEWKVGDERKEATEQP